MDPSDAATRKVAGARLKSYIQDRMAEKGIPSLRRLSIESPVSYDTLHAWFRGRAPQPGAGGRVAVRLGVTYSELLAAYEGVEPQGRYITDERLEDLMRAAAEAAVRIVMGPSHDGSEPTG